MDYSPLLSDGVNTIHSLRLDMAIMDNLTGEKLKYIKFDGRHIVCSGEDHVLVWLIPSRVKIVDSVK